MVLFKFVKQSQTLLTCLQHAPLLYCIVAFSLLHAALFEVFTLSLHIYSEHSRRQAACGLELLLITSQTGLCPLPPLHPHPSPPHWPPSSLSPVSYCPVHTPGRGGSFLCTHCSWPQQPHCNQELYEWPFLSTFKYKNAQRSAWSCLKHWDCFNAMNVKQ